MKYTQFENDRLIDLVDLWNQELGDEFPMRTALFEQNSFLDINLFGDGSLIAVNDDDRVIGFVVTKKWQDDIDVGISKETGWIQVLLVDREYRNQGIGRRLLNHAEAKLKESGMSRILLGMDTWHYFPGVPIEYQSSQEWFERQGYKKGVVSHDLDCHFKDKDSASLPAKVGVEFTLLHKEEKEAFLSFLHRCFPGRWEYEAIQYFNKGGTGREFVVGKKHGNIIGFCRINDSNSPFIAQNVYWAPLYHGELGGIGPLGIDENERKNGYGLAIVAAGVYFLRSRNIQSIVIDWTGLVEFYQKLGFDVCKSYQSYQKALN